MSLFKKDWRNTSRRNPFDYPLNPYQPPYTEYDYAQMNSLHRKWTRFEEAYPYNAKLLILLFGDYAMKAHMEAEIIPEEKACFVVQILRASPNTQEPRRVDNLLPMGDA